MSSETKYLYGNTDLTKVINQSKTVFLQKMLNEGEINEETYNKLNEYSLLVTKKGLLGSFWDRLWNNKKSDDTLMLVVKVLADTAKQ